MWLHLKKWSLALVFALGVQGFAYAAVGEVIFSVGEAKLEGSAQPLKRGDALDVGQTVVTGANGHVHIRFVDQAFVSVRPDSTLKIEQYLYDSATPGNNQVKFSLVKGTSRLITGKAGQANKQGFRLNTPIAAIGIRGTDFLVQTDDRFTRVAVQQGGVSLAPLGQECSAQALGPCAGGMATELLGSLSGRYLEVQAQSAPHLVVPEQAGVKSIFPLPRPEEPKVNGTSAKTADNNGLQNSSHFSWGRWSTGLTTPLGYELLGKNDVFVLYRAQDSVNLPQSGYVHFAVTNSQAYARSSDGVLNSAHITAPSLAVNFANMAYSTQFNWNAEGQKLKLYSKGSVDADGHFVAQRNASNFALSGGLSADGNAAAYLFLKRLAGDDAYGVVHWAK